MITEDQLEQLCLEWFQSNGYSAVCGYDIAPNGLSPIAMDYHGMLRALLNLKSVDMMLKYPSRIYYYSFQRLLEAL